jgi:FkbM family methyltransferase
MSYEKLINKITKKVVLIIPKRLYSFFSLIKHYIFKGYGERFYSQDGIDAILQRIFDYKKIFYIDVGANHPFWASNTYSFYRNGSRGINIDATPGSMKLFRLTRRRDINIEAAISDKSEKMKYFLFDENSSALNSFSEKISLEQSKKNKLRKIITVQPRKLSEILDKYLPTGIQIDLLSIDTEGHDLHVLKSNNWDKYKPRYIIVEESKFSIESFQKSKIYSFLKSKGYRIIAFDQLNVLYQLE